MYLVNDVLIKIIFGLKVKELRQNLNLSPHDLADKTGISLSYLNEIENGKKYPKHEKIVSLSEALNVSYDELVSLKLSKTYQALSDIIQSNVLQSLPLELFEIKIEKIISIVANAPAKVGAFISSLVEIAKMYQFSQEDFYFAVLRKYQEMHENYFKDIEIASQEFSNKILSQHKKVDTIALINILKNNYKIDVELTDFSTDVLLKNFRTIYIKKHKKLLLNEKMSVSQQRFLLMKEIGCQYLHIEKYRIYTTPIYKVNSFEEALHNFQASYFASATLIPENDLVKDLKKWFQQTKWSQENFFQMLTKYNATPEMFLQRLVSMLPQFFKIKQLFFLRFEHDVNTDTFTLNKEFHLPEKHFPQARISKEHYCRRWVAIRSLKLLAQNQHSEHEVIIQRTKEQNTGSEYLSLSIAKTKIKNNLQHINTSVTVGLLIDKELDKHIKFWHDENIQPIVVNQTCERCIIDNCKERVAQPTIYEKQEEFKLVQDKMKQLGAE